MHHICCFRPTLRKLELPDRFYNTLQYKMLHKSDQCESLDISCIQTDGRTDMTRLTVALRNVLQARLKMVFEDRVKRYGPVATVTSYGVLPKTQWAERPSCSEGLFERTAELWKLANTSSDGYTLERLPPPLSVNMRHFRNFVIGITPDDISIVVGSQQPLPEPLPAG